MIPKINRKYLYLGFLYLLLVQLHLGFTNCSLKPDLIAAATHLTPYPAPIMSGVSPDKIFVGGGARITLTGKNFFSGLQVTVDDKDCPLLSITGEETIVCRAPALSAGVHTLKILGFDGKTDSTTITYDTSSFTEVGLVVGNPNGVYDCRPDGYFSAGNSCGASHMVYDNGKLYTAEYDIKKIRSIDLSDSFSTTLIGNGTNYYNWPAEQSLPTSINNPTCLTKAGDKLYFCPTDDLIVAYDMISKTAHRIAGIESNQSGYFTFNADPLLAELSNVNAAHALNNKIYLFDVDNTEQWILKIDLSATPHTLAKSFGCKTKYAADYDLAPYYSYAYVCVNEDDPPTPITEIDPLGDVQVSTILGDKIYFMTHDYDNSSNYLKVFDPQAESVTRVFGPGASEDDPQLVDGTFDPLSSETKGRIGNSVYGMTEFEGKLLFYEQYQSRGYLRTIDLDAKTIKTLISFPISSSPQLGLLDGAFKARGSQLRGLSYVPNVGILLGFSDSLLRVY